MKVATDTSRKGLVRRRSGISAAYRYLTNLVFWRPYEPYMARLDARVVSKTKPLLSQGFLVGGQGQDRTADPRFFRPVLYQLSYLTIGTTRTMRSEGVQDLAGATGFEPATSGLTGRRELQTSPRPRVVPPGEFESPLPP